jgi:hypothetical protein
MASTSVLDRIGVGIDTARYGHRVSFLRPDRKPAAKPITVMENHAGYQSFKDTLLRLREQNPGVEFHVRIDAAGQYAQNLEQYLRSLDLPMTISVGEPKRNKDYRKAHFPKRTTDDTESQAMARFAIVEQPPATPAPSAAMIALHEVAGRLQARVKQTTQAVNRLHNLLARCFPELATLTDDIAAGWVLCLLENYPTAERIAAAHLASLEKIPYLSAVWKTDRPFDANHYPWENPSDDAAQDVAASSVGATDSGNNKAEGHKQDKPAEKVVTSAHSTIEPAPLPVKPELPPAAAHPHVDFAFLRQQISLEQVLKHLDLLRHLRGSGPQRRGCCPVHSHPADQERTFSVHLAKNAFRCFQKNCGVQGNALDLWAAIHRLPLYDAALHLAETFGLPRNRGEEPVKGTR